jgi:phage terminase small subunit
MAKRAAGKQVAEKREGLSPKHQLFVAGILAGKSQVDAYLAAGYKDGSQARKHAARLATNEDIRTAIAGGMAVTAARSVATVERLELELERLALADVRKLYAADGTLKPPAEWDDDTAAAVGSVESKEADDGTTTPKVKCWPKGWAIVELLKRRDKAAQAPVPPTPGSSKDTPFHVSISDRIADLESTFASAADRAGQSSVPGDS